MVPARTRSQCVPFLTDPRRRLRQFHFPFRRDKGNVLTPGNTLTAWNHPVRSFRFRFEKRLFCSQFAASSVLVIDPSTLRVQVRPT